MKGTPFFEQLKPLYFLDSPGFLKMANFEVSLKFVTNKDAKFQKIMVILGIFT
jgi:hypothetical protein